MIRSRLMRSACRIVASSTIDAQDLTVPLPYSFSVSMVWIIGLFSRCSVVGYWYARSGRYRDAPLDTGPWRHPSARPTIRTAGPSDSLGRLYTSVVHRALGLPLELPRLARPAVGHGKYSNAARHENDPEENERRQRAQQILNPVAVDNRPANAVQEVGCGRDVGEDTQPWRKHVHAVVHARDQEDDRLDHERHLRPPLRVQQRQHPRQDAEPGHADAAHDNHHRGRKPVRLPQAHAEDRHYDGVGKVDRPADESRLRYSFCYVQHLVTPVT